MTKSDQLAGVFSDRFSEQEHTRGQFTNPSGGVGTRFEFYQDSLNLQDSGLRIFKETATGSVAIWDFHNWNDTVALWGPGTAYTRETITIGNLQI